MTVVIKKQNYLDNTTVPESFPSLSTPVTSTAGNAPGKSSYANITSKPSRKKVNVHTLFTPEGNGIDVVVPVDSVRAISERFANTTYGFFLGTDSFMDGLDSMLENGPCVPIMTFNEYGLSVIATKLGKLRLLDNDGNPLVPTDIMESDSEVEVVFNDTANLRISTSGKDGSDKGYGTNSLLQQLRDSYPNNDDYDPYDDDMYENHDLSEHLQSICDDLDITVRGRKKK
ncbi:hypothetical protein Tco_0393267 [Tanacetum coccineum]